MKKKINVEKRVHDLEKKMRLQNFALLLFAAIFVGAWFQEHAAPEVLKARRFVLVDGKGLARAEIKIDDGCAGFYVLDAAQKTRVSLTHDSSQTALFLWDGAGHVRVGAAQFAHGGGGFTLHGPESKGAAALYLKGKGSLSFYDAEGHRTHRVPEK